MKPGAVFAEHYRVLSQLGVGGMGEVYLVENVRLGRREALKLLHTTGDDEAVTRFEREARTAARLSHPSIAGIYHYGTEDGRPWFTMVYVEGTDLTNATLTDAEAITVLRSVAEAIDYAHDQHVVHRDIKPANLMVSRNRSGRIDRAYVLDFGIARPEGDPRITHANMYIGTVAYSAPETFAGDAVGASDIYSLACTAFELLSAKTPFDADTVTQLMIAHASWPPAKLSQYREDLAAADPVFDRALAKEPEDRYGSCVEFVDALEQAIRTSPTGGSGSAAFPVQSPGGPVSGPQSGFAPQRDPRTPPPSGPHAPHQAPPVSNPPGSNPQGVPVYGSTPQTPMGYTPNPQSSSPQSSNPQSSNPQNLIPIQTPQHPPSQHPTPPPGRQGGYGYGPGVQGTPPYGGGVAGGQGPGGTSPLGLYSGAQATGGQPSGGTGSGGMSKKALGWLIGAGVLILVVAIVAFVLIGRSGGGDGTDDPVASSSSVSSSSVSSTANTAGTIDSSGYVFNGSATGTPRSCRWIRVVPLATAQTGKYGKMSSEIVNQLGCINVKLETVMSRCKELMPNESGYCAFWDPQGVLSGKAQSGRPLLIILRKTCLDRENKTKWSAGPIGDDCITYPKQP
ncbi:protein kinase [Gordonia amarae]|uniref:non-specific serine/threonine protein kinase n=2 Tax=Gordonia amarae TaxID=36821 RepID=G7GIR6_9ACTN|nr:protein kinase [Gordonia amarae]MCS3879144.1 serine/threonine protein kinase [Gordonia amarae]QHN17666.1 protein kinase [Gordonia amarae]QHN22196.1 protein kinase [Gordonia amarae]QHN31073.1 protein kinase [Gordonia amarae]QHN39818.1 protein kinase [Gordonia amarae]